MANGIINLGTNKSNFEGRITWESASNGSQYNNSYVAGHLQVRRNDGYTTKGTWTGQLRIHNSVNSFSRSSTSVGSDWVTMLEFYVNDVPHNPDGTGSCRIEGYCNGPSGTSMAGASVSGGETVTLDRIPRASSVGCPDGNIGSSTTININRASSSFTHKLTYLFGNLNQVIVERTDQTSYSWTIPTSFYAQIPNSQSGQGTISCETYSGNTHIGTTYCTFNAFVVNSNPTISATIVDTNTTTTALTGNSNKLVKYFSNAKVTVTATPKNSATIKQKKVNGEVISGNEKTINKVENNSFTVECLDSRNLPASQTYTKATADWIEYINLAMTTLDVTRESSTSNTVKINIKGNYFNSSFGATANTLSLKWRYKEGTGAYSGYTTITPTISGNTFTYSGTLGTNFDYQKEYTFEVVAQDKLITSTLTRPVTRGVPLIDIWNGNVGINGNIPVTGEIKKNNGYADIFRGGLINSGDMNNCITEGFYQISDGVGNKISNTPYTGKIWGYLRTEVSTGTTWNKINNWIWQTFKDTSNREYIRYAVNAGDFSPWTRKYNAYSLFENPTGQTGTVEMNESAGNYDYLEIYVLSTSDADTGYAQNSTRVFKPNGKTAWLTSGYCSNTSNDSYNIKLTSALISGKTITRPYGAWEFKAGASSNTNYIGITKVIGYK